MFTKIKHSLGELDEDELSIASSVLKGEDWGELLGEPPPGWLLKWSKTWKAIPLYSMDSGSDPLFSNGSIWCDRAHVEFWFCDEGCEQPPCLAKIPNLNGKPGVAEVCETVFTYIRETFSEFPLRANFEILNKRLLPRRRMETFLSNLMREHRIFCMETENKLTLEMWLEREYAHLSRHVKKEQIRVRPSKS
jgi:hypothetical protein